VENGKGAIAVAKMNIFPTMNFSKVQNFGKVLY